MMPPGAIEAKAVLLFALLNPVSIVVALWMGRRATQWEKVPLAAFAAAAAGLPLLSLADRLALPFAHAVMPAAVGVFIAQFLLGLGWAAVGYRLARRSP
jgi:hypothetical protein